MHATVKSAGSLSHSCRRGETRRSVSHAQSIRIAVVGESYFGIRIKNRQVIARSPLYGKSGLVNTHHSDKSLVPIR